MDEPGDELSPHPLWIEAAGVVQADHDVDVRLEARGLAIAEMSDVTFTERVAAVQAASELAVLLRNHARIAGGLVQVGSDFLVLRAPHPVLIPGAAIVAISSLPRVLHEEPTPTQNARAVTWRSTLRESLGQSLRIEAGGVRHVGRLTWVGSDHVSLSSAGPSSLEDTIRWDFVDSVALPTTWEPVA